MRKLFNAIGIVLIFLFVSGLLINNTTMVAIGVVLGGLWAILDIFMPFLFAAAEPKLKQVHLDEEIPFTEEELVKAKAVILSWLKSTPEAEMDLVTFTCVCGHHANHTPRQAIELVEKEQGFGKELIEACADLERLEY